MIPTQGYTVGGYTASGGYTCAGCGMFVNAGWSHTCPTFPSVISSPIPVVRWDRTQEILDTLRALTEAVNALAAKVGNDG